MTLCAYKVEGDTKAGLWVEHPLALSERMVRIVLALRAAYDEGHGLELAFEDWDL